MELVTNGTLFSQTEIPRIPNRNFPKFFVNGKRPSSKKRKKGTKNAVKNENTTMSEQAKVGGKLKLRLSGIKPAKDRVESLN